MPTFSPDRSAPITLDSTLESRVYGFFALALALTVLGVYLGIQYAWILLTTGVSMVLLLAELVLIFTSRFWVNRSPLNLILYVLFPLISGVTVTPYILSVLVGYANGGAILLNALGATACMTLAAAFLPKATGWDMGPAAMRALLISVIGLLFLGVFQVFVPALRTGAVEMLISGAGIVVFALFTAFDLQKLRMRGYAGVHPLLLALNLYLDIFNLFLYVLRFMVSASGRRN